MESKELRIGNLVDIYRESGLDLIPCKNSVIDVEDLRCIFKDYIQAEPIPLTEEWLLKFGFTRTSGWDDYEGWIKDDVEIECNIYTFNYVNCIDKEIKYIHQLQNLYFALTNKELEIC